MLEETANGKQLQADNNNLKSKVSALEQEVKELTYRNEKLSEEVSALGREAHSVRSRSEEAIHNSSIDLSDLKMAHLKEKSELTNVINDLRKRGSELERYLCMKEADMKRNEEHGRNCS